jgi:hypothetical protein
MRGRNVLPLWQAIFHDYFYLLFLIEEKVATNNLYSVYIFFELNISILFLVLGMLLIEEETHYQHT